MTRTAQQTALSDQALAVAREEARSGVLAVAVTVADGGQCSWCDCNVLADEDDHRCAGCPRAAVFVMHQFRPGGGVRNDLPLCAEHRDDAVGFVFALAQAGGWS